MKCYLYNIKIGFCRYINSLKNIFLKYFLKILKILPIMILIFIFLSLSVLFFHCLDIHNPNDFETQEIYIHGISLNNWCSWITLIGLFFTAIWSMHQYTKSRLSAQQEKASQIATDFADNIIEKFGLISKTLLANKEVGKIVKKINNNPNALSQFTVFEIQDIFGNEKIFEIFNAILFSSETQKIYEKLLNEKYSKSEQKKFNSKFPILVESTLNHLEALCINISSQAAGSQFIYDSLHQTFLMTIQILSILISENNNNNVDKYFTNIIQVYNMWNTQKIKDIKKYNKTSKKVTKLQNKVDKEIKKLLSKENKTI